MALTVAVTVTVLALAAVGAVTYFVVLPIISENPECKSLSLDALSCLYYLTQKNAQQNLTYSISENLTLEQKTGQDLISSTATSAATINEDRSGNKSRIKLVGTILGITSETSYYYLPEGNF